MVVISASEANRAFSRLLREVSQGIRFTVVSRGRPVATISGPEPDVEHYRTAREALLKRLQGQPATGEPRDWQRDDLYDV